MAERRIMEERKSRERMKVILVTDIFGLCESIDKWVTYFTQRHASVHVCDPYAGVRHHFPHEQDAYSAFMTTCGHDAYFADVQAQVASQPFDVIVGFSAGANVVWRLSDLPTGSDRQMICFYPTRLHHYLDVQPKAMVEMIFPISEPGFDVSDMLTEMQSYERVSTHRVPFEHGFMNNRSAAYSEEAEKWGVACLQESLRSLL